MADDGDGLQRRTLGETGLSVTEICVGTAPLGSMPEAYDYSVAEEQALETIRAIFDGPITFMDTAASYGDGESERRIGIVLRERGGLPPGFVLATKADRDLQTGDFSGDAIARSIERSLRLLGLDRLQLVYLHDPEHTPFETVMAPGGPVEVMRRYQEEGAIDHLGVAAGPIDVSIRYVETGIFPVAISHNRYTLLNRAADRFWDVCRQRGVATVNAAPYNSGILIHGPHAHSHLRYVYRNADEAILNRARRLQEICERHHVPLGAVALQFSLRDSRITSTIVGMARPEMIEETVLFAQYRIPDEVWEEIATVPFDIEDP